MTVCIAAIHNDGGIIEIADKMISTEGMAFEPKGNSKKIFTLCAAINALNAGHIGLQAEIMESMQALGNAERSQNREKKFTVKELVDRYVDCYNEIKRKRIKDLVFAPWNLDENSFLARQKEFSDVFVRDLMDQAAQVRLPDVATIIAGVDMSTGQLEPHIYCIQRGYHQNSIECCDAVGYAIGSGAHHVESYFMQSQFTRHFSMPKALLLSYFAKRRSEIAPNVGEQTEILLVGPTFGVNATLENVLDWKKMDEMYEKIVLSEKAQTDGALVEIADYLKDKLPILAPSKFG